MLSYGLVFHLGFVNFYVSAGLCLWILGLCWNFSRKRILAAVPLAILAWMADALAYLGRLILAYFGDAKIQAMAYGGASRRVAALRGPSGFS